jgi:branched-chain amino acid transport system substrate-binding protein
LHSESLSSPIVVNATTHLAQFPGGDPMVPTARQLMVLSVALTLHAGSVSAQMRYSPGASDTEIKIGNIMPYSGPASAYGIIGKTMSAYFRMVNDNGGINGRKINFISYDDAYSPPKTVEQARRLVESDEVFLIFAPVCTENLIRVDDVMESHKLAE